VRFKYRLDGLDTDWIDGGTSRVAEYTHLAPGTYTFRVSACNDDGVWNDTGASLAILQEPFFFQTTEFYAACVFAGVLIVVLGDRWRVRRMKRHQQELAACVAQRTQALQAEITEHARTEQALRHAKNVAEDAARAKSEFLANMSHEIRTPMNGVLGTAELLLGTPLTAEQLEYTRMMRSAAEALLRVINDILDFSKIEAGRLEIESVGFDLREVLGDVLKELGAPAHAKRLELACQIAPDVPDEVLGDPVRLRQVVTNLVGNAIKFTPKGEVVVSVAVDRETGRQGDRETRRQGDKETGRQGDTETGRQGDRETRRRRLLARRRGRPVNPSPCLLVSLSPCLSRSATPASASQPRSSRRSSSRLYRRMARRRGAMAGPAWG
jgi:signal transduction histidine kinase